MFTCVLRHSNQWRCPRFFSNRRFGGRRVLRYPDAIRRLRVLSSLPLFGGVRVGCTCPRCHPDAPGPSSSAACSFRVPSSRRSSLLRLGEPRARAPTVASASTELPQHLARHLFDELLPSAIQVSSRCHGAARPAVLAVPRAPSLPPFGLSRLRARPRFSTPAPARRRRAPERVPQDRRYGEARGAEGERQGQEPSAAEEVQWHRDEAQALRLLLQQAALRHARRRPQQDDPLLRQHGAEVHLRRPALQHRGSGSKGRGGAHQGVQGAGHLRDLVLRSQRVCTRGEDDGVRGSGLAARVPAKIAKCWYSDASESGGRLY